MNFVVLADKRTGSSFFMETLNSHPELVCYDELYMIRGATKSGKRRGQYLYRYMKNTKNMSMDQYLDFIYNDGKKNISKSFRLMYPQNDYWKVLPLIKERNIPVIHLVRNNLLKVVMSKRTKGIFVPKKMYYDPNMIIKDINNHRNKQVQNRKHLKGYKNILNVSYEDMIGRSEGEKGETKKFGAFNLKSNMITYLAEETSKKVCDFLKVEQKEMFCNVTKKNSNNVWDYIENVDEIKNALKQNKFEF